jgi:hypothetical protein
LLLDPNKSCPSVVILPQQSHQAKEAAKKIVKTQQRAAHPCTREIVMKFCGIKIEFRHLRSKLQEHCTQKKVLFW